MAEEIRPGVVLCNQTHCLHCVKLNDPVPIEATREVGWTPAFPMVFQNKCDRKNIVLTKDGKCDSFAHRHPDKMFAAFIRAKGHPSAEVLNLEPPKYPTLDERLEVVWHMMPHGETKFEMSPEVRAAMHSAYLAGRADEKYGTKLDE